MKTARLKMLNIGLWYPVPRSSPLCYDEVESKIRTGNNGTLSPHFTWLHGKFPCKACEFGFTLVELLIVMAIIAILVGLVIAGIGYANMSSRNNQRMTSLGNVDKALIAFYDDNGYFPSSLSNSFDQVLNNYLGPYLEGSWEAPTATVAYYRTDSKSMTYLVCFGLEVYLRDDRLYACKGSGIGKSEGNWPQKSDEIACEDPVDPVDCGAGPVTWEPTSGTWSHGTP